jgi:hypothetical protein
LASSFEAIEQKLSPLLLNEDYIILRGDAWIAFDQAEISLSKGLEFYFL